jgi:hypothetical protein
VGHNISAAIVRGAIDAEVARSFDMRVIQLAHELWLIPLDPAYCDHWTEELGIDGFVTETPLLNCKVVHHMVLRVCPRARFAVIETDYAGGAGTQSAVVYDGSNVLMEPKEADRGPINEALRLLGVKPTPGRDEFEAIGLHKWRRFDDAFEKYY